MCEQDQGVTPSGPGCQPSASAPPLRSGSSRSGIPNAPLLDIAERCEKAGEPDRELDVLIWADQLGYAPQWQGNCLVVGIEGVVGWIDPGEHRRNFHTNRATIGPARIPAFTCSLDAAMTLAEGLEQYGGAQGMLREAMDRLWSSRFFGVLRAAPLTAEGYREALARFLTAACLRAHFASAMSAGTAETAQQAQGRSPASAVAESETPNE